MAQLTSSRYEGPVENGWYQGFGRYFFPNNVIYEGYFDKGEFHGEGTLIYPNGGKYVAKWERGKMMEGKYYFYDNLEYDFNNWNYSTLQDRRFYIEVQKGLRPEGQTLMSNNMKGAAQIPEGTYDVGDGYYDPIKGIVCDYKGEFSRDLEEGEVEWILQKCRYNPRKFDKESEMSGETDRIIQEMIEINKAKYAKKK